MTAGADDRRPPQAVAGEGVCSLDRRDGGQVNKPPARRGAASLRPAGGGGPCGSHTPRPRTDGRRRRPSGKPRPRTDGRRRRPSGKPRAARTGGGDATRAVGARRVTVLSGASPSPPHACRRRRPRDRRPGRRRPVRQRPHDQRRRLLGPAGRRQRLPGAQLLAAGPGRAAHVTRPVPRSGGDPHLHVLHLPEHLPGGGPADPRRARRSRPADTDPCRQRRPRPGHPDQCPALPVQGIPHRPHALPARHPRRAEPRSGGPTASPPRRARTSRTPTTPPSSSSSTVPATCATASPTPNSPPKPSPTTSACCSPNRRSGPPRPSARPAPTRPHRPAPRLRRATPTGRCAFGARGARGASSPSAPLLPGAEGEGAPEHPTFQRPTDNLPPR